MKAIEIAFYGFMWLAMASITFVASFFLGEVEAVFLFLALLPVGLARLFYGQNYLDKIENVYGVTVPAQLTALLPFQLFPYFPLSLLVSPSSMEVERDTAGFSGIIINLDAVPLVVPVLATLSVFLLFYGYRENYFEQLKTWI